MNKKIMLIAAMCAAMSFAVAGCTKTSAPEETTSAAIETVETQATVETEAETIAETIAETEMQEVETDRETWAAEEGDENSEVGDGWLGGDVEDDGEEAE